MAASVLLFDLGGVLVDWRGLRELERLTAPRHDAQEVRRRYIASEIVRRYETGQCSRGEFAEGFVEEWRLDLPPAAFLELFTAWLGGPFPDTAETLAALKGRYRLACLSNSNELHWDLMMQHHGLAALLDHCYGSHLLQLAKPEAAVFRLVLERLGVAPSEVVFFDDGADNVAAAAALGIESHLVDPRFGVRPKLEELALI